MPRDRSSNWSPPILLCLPVLVAYVLVVPSAAWIRGTGESEYLPASVAALGCLTGTLLAWLMIRHAAGGEGKTWAMVLGLLPRTLAPLVGVAIFSIFVERVVSLTAIVYCIVFYPVTLASESWLMIGALRSEEPRSEESRER